MKNLKSILALLLALVMVLSLAACGGNSAEDTKAPAADDTKAPAADDDTTAAAADGTSGAEALDWLNLGGVYPIVDEGVEKTLSICLPIDDATVDTYKDRFQYKFITEQMNINLEVIAVPGSAWGEKLPLLLADVENLPDIFMSTGWGTGDLLRYGAQEGLIVDIAPYINEQYMPCLTALFADHPEYRTPWTDTEGRVWGVNLISDVSGSDVMHWHYLNYKWMEDCGLNPETDLPSTLDEFTDLMRLFKEKKSAELGKEIYPISGLYTQWNGIYKYLLAACGFVGSNRDSSFPGGEINMRNGKVVLPCADREGWEGFVKTLKLWYDEGLVHPEFFTGEGSALDALISAGETGFTTVPPFVWVGTGERLAEWWGAPLLTSEWCDKPGVPSNASGNGSPISCITTACEELELALAFFDWFYFRGETAAEQNHLWFCYGLTEDHELADVYPEAVWCEDQGYGMYVVGFDSEKHVDANDMLKKEINLWSQGCIGYYCVDGPDGKVLSDPETQATVEKYIDNPAQSYAGIGAEARGDMVVMQGIAPKVFNYNYLVASNEEFPAVRYFDAETQEVITDLFVAIKEYANAETAKFITGERPIEELNNYFDEIEALGALEYVQIHQDYYDAIYG